jgi:hypothetical protein
MYGCRLDSFGPRQGQVALSNEHGNGPSGSINGGKVLEQLLKYDSAAKNE